VPQPVRVDLAQASTPAAVKDNHRHATGRQRPVWRFDPHEHAASLRHRSPTNVLTAVASYCSISSSSVSSRRAFMIERLQPSKLRTESRSWRARSLDRHG
jgi:hypothetical protein